MDEWKDPPEGMNGAIHNLNLWAERGCGGNGDLNLARALFFGLGVPS